MQRRSFLSSAGLAGILATGMAPTVHAGQSIRWRLASRFPKILDIPHDGVQVFAQTVRELSGGKFEIAIHNADDLPASSGVLDGVQRGSIECGHTSPAYYIEKDETFALDCSIPFGFNARQMNAWMREGHGMELLREFYKGYGIVNFPMGNTGAQMGGWFRKPVRSTADLRKLKMRVTGLGAEVARRLGVQTSQQAGGEIYKALERGLIDAAEWSGPYDDLKLGIDRLAPHYAYPGWWEGGAQMSLYINHRAYDALNNENQAIIAAAAMEAHLDIQASYDAHNTTALKELIAGGARLAPFPRTVLDAAYKAAMDYYAELSRRNPRWKKIYASYAQYLHEQAWGWGYAEMAYASYMHDKALERTRLEARLKNRR